MRSYHDEIRETFYDEGYVVMALNDKLQQTLVDQGYTLTPATEWRAKRRSALQQSRTRLGLDVNGDKPGTTPEDRATIPGFECYQDVESTIDTANSLVSNNPSLATMIDIGDSWNKENGLAGYDLWVLQLTNQEITGPKPTLFIQSAMHAREYATAQLTLDFAKHMLDGYGVDADITWILNHHDIQILLQANPDGRKIAETGLLWRKNTNISHCPEVLPGVDLNRNYSLFWGFDNIGSSDNPCNARFRGTFAASEPETDAVEAYIRTLFPDQRGPDQKDPAPLATSGIHLDIHSFGELILWPWGHTETPTGNHFELRSLGRKFTYKTNYFPTQAFGLGATNGASDEVSYGELGVAAYTFELGTTFFQDCNTYVNTTRAPNITALKYAAKVVRAPYQLPSGPEISHLTINGARTAQSARGIPVTLDIIADDTLFSDANGNEPTHTVVAVDLYLNTLPWAATSPTISLNPSDGTADNAFEAFTLQVNTGQWPVGRHTVYAQARDSQGQLGPIRAAFIDIFPEDLENPGEPIIPPDFELPNAASSSWLHGLWLFCFGLAWRTQNKAHK